MAAVLGAVVLALVFVSPASAARASRQVTQLPGGGYVIVPKRAAAIGARVTVRTMRTQSKADVAVRGHKYRLGLVGARRVRARLVLRYDPSLVPAGLNAADVFRIAAYRGGSWRYLPTRANRRTRTVSAAITIRGRQSRSRISLPFVDYAMVSDVQQALGQVLGTRLEQPSCDTRLPSWVDNATTLARNEMVVSCGMSDPKNADVFEYRIGNNRSYGQWLEFSAKPNWAWVVDGGWYDQAVAPHVSRYDRSRDQYYLPPRTVAHFGFADTGWRTMSVVVSPATETILAEYALTLVAATLGTPAMPRVVQLPAAIGSCGWDTTSLVTGSQTVVSKVRQLVSQGVQCAVDIAGADAPKGKLLMLKAVGAAITLIDVQQYATDIVEMSLGTTWHLGVERTRTSTPTTPTTSEPAPGDPAPAVPTPKGFVIEDSYHFGTWARLDPNNGTWYTKNSTPPNGKYWFANGLGVAVDCARSAAEYTVRINGATQTWTWWAHVTDNTWVPTAVFSSVWADGNPGVAPC